MLKEIVALISDRTVRMLGLILISALAIGSVTYTGIQIRAFDHLRRENDTLIAEVADLKIRLAVAEARLDRRLSDLEEAVMTKREQNQNLTPRKQEPKP